MGLNEGLSSNIFAVAFIVSLIVMYDASGVRLHAGKQAQVCAPCAAPRLAHAHGWNPHQPCRKLVSHAASVCSAR